MGSCIGRGIRRIVYPKKVLLSLDDIDSVLTHSTEEYAKSSPNNKLVFNLRTIRLSTAPISPWIIKAEFLGEYDAKEFSSFLMYLGASLKRFDYSASYKTLQRPHTITTINIMSIACQKYITLVYNIIMVVISIILLGLIGILPIVYLF